jgi:hypothetical protein
VRLKRTEQRVDLSRRAFGLHIEFSGYTLHDVRPHGTLLQELADISSSFIEFKDPVGRDMNEDRSLSEAFGDNTFAEAEENTRMIVVS